MFCIIYIYIFIYLFIYLFNYLFIYLFIYLFVYLFLSLYILYLIMYALHPQERHRLSVRTELMERFGQQLLREEEAQQRSTVQMQRAKDGRRVYSCGCNNTIITILMLLLICSMYRIFSNISIKFSRQFSNQWIPSGDD